jgi:hypothetical protein
LLFCSPVCSLELIIVQVVVFSLDGAASFAGASFDASFAGASFAGASLEASFAGASSTGTFAASVLDGLVGMWLDGFVIDELLFCTGALDPASGLREVVVVGSAVWAKAPPEPLVPPDLLLVELPPFAEPPFDAPGAPPDDFCGSLADGAVGAVAVLVVGVAATTTTRPPSNAIAMTTAIAVNTTVKAAKSSITARLRSSSLIHLIVFDHITHRLSSSVARSSSTLSRPPRFSLHRNIRKLQRDGLPSRDHSASAALSGLAISAPS